MKRRNENGNGLIILVFAVTVIVLIVVAGVALQSHTKTTRKTMTTADTSSQGTLRGFSLSPKSYDSAGFVDFFGKVHSGNIVEWQGDWDELGRSGTGASLVLNAASTYTFVPVLVVSAFKDGARSSSVPIRPLTSDQQDVYIAKARDFAQQYQPAYFGVGVEINRVYETSRSDYQQFVKLFNQTVSAVHAVSPHTKVFTTFQLERLKGLRGGLFGGTNDTAANNWNMLADFSQADLLGFTSYPGIIYKRPSDIPSDYYQDIRAHTAKPVAFTELGWPAADEAPGWTSSQADQASFVRRFNGATTALPPRLIVWSFVYDQQVSAPFDHLGLLNSDGSQRPAASLFTNP